ncbi:hypothetical protein [Intestinimonas butyriciproducens]|uniref:hypothetical protein n=1 Tax=Intestinimonas butyriciproducens TaxID=1297617 RepID=UPI00195D99F7|nr:hypothetical protein [Intestinimonas butyriciproducens]MBM6977400.1 hypothetical protein [Intestinimonas butyriciproducens]
MNYKTSILARMLYLLSVMLLLLLILVSTYNSTSSPDLPNIQLQYKPVSITGNTYYLITQDGTLLVWGENINDFDSLGKEFVINGSITAKPIASDVTAVFSGRFDLLALNRSGELLGWYRFAYSKALGKYQDIKQANIPRILLNDVVSADIGLSHYLAIRSDGFLYGGGDNKYSQLGTATADEWVDTPVQIFDAQVLSAATDGLNGNYCVFLDHSLVFWGISSQNGITYSEPIPIADHIIRVFPGNLALSEENTLYQIRYHSDFSKFTLEKILDDVKWASDCVAIKNDGSLWAWGNDQPIANDDYTSDEFLYAIKQSIPSKILDSALYSARGLFYTFIVQPDGTVLQLPNYEIMKQEQKNSSWITYPYVIPFHVLQPY